MCCIMQKVNRNASGADGQYHFNTKGPILLKSFRCNVLRNRHVTFWWPHVLTKCYNINTSIPHFFHGANNLIGSLPATQHYWCLCKGTRRSILFCHFQNIYRLFEICTIVSNTSLQLLHCFNVVCKNMQPRSCNLLYTAWISTEIRYCKISRIRLQDMTVIDRGQMIDYMLTCKWLSNSEWNMSLTKCFNKHFWL